MRADLLALLLRTGDPLAGAFARRDQPGILRDALQRLKSEYERAPEDNKAASSY